MIQPNAGQPVDARRLDAERRNCPDDRLLQVAHVLLNVLAVTAQVEDRVADELPRAVERRLAAAVRFDDLDVGVARHVELAGLGPPPERDHRRVLEDEHRVRQLAGADGRRDPAL